MHPYVRSSLAGSAALVGALGLTLASAATASAHVTATASTNAAGSYSVLTFSVPHGCEGSPTTGIQIKIPANILAVTPTRNPLYKLSVVPEQLRTPVKDAHGNTVTERVGRVDYTAITPLPDHERDTFQLSLKLPDDAAGKTIYFPTVQQCEKGESAWVQVPADGQSVDDLDLPAPAIKVGPASNDSSTPSATPAVSSDSTSASDRSGAPWALTITALVLGAAGLVVGGLALARGRTRR